LQADRAPEKAKSALSSPAIVENVFDVDRIVGQKMIDGLRRFRVRWTGFAPQHDTWEPADNIADIVCCTCELQVLQVTLLLSGFTRMEGKQASV
jgi:hypothetical protein